MRYIMAIGMTACVALGIATVDSDTAFAARMILAGLSPAILVLVCTGLSKAGHAIARLWHMYVEYSREQAKQDGTAVYF